MAIFVVVSRDKSDRIRDVLRDLHATRYSTDTQSSDPNITIIIILLFVPKSLQFSLLLSNINRFISSLRTCFPYYLRAADRGFCCVEEPVVTLARDPFSLPIPSDTQYIRARSLRNPRFSQHQHHCDPRIPHPLPRSFLSSFDRSIGVGNAW